MSERKGYEKFDKLWDRLLPHQAKYAKSAVKEITSIFGKRFYESPTLRLALLHCLDTGLATSLEVLTYEAKARRGERKRRRA